MSFVGCGFWVYMPNENHITIPMKKLTETVLSTYSQLSKKNLVNKQKKKKKNGQWRDLERVQWETA